MPLSPVRKCGDVEWLAVHPFEGASRQIYAFYLSFRQNFAANPLSRYGGLFLFARQESVAPAIIFVGNAASLAEDALAFEPWDTAARKYRASLLYFRVNTDAASRAREVSDLIAKHRPIMNTEQRDAR